MSKATYKAILNGRPKRDGTHTIMLRITVNRKHKYLSTGYAVFPKDWNRDGTFVKRNFIRKSHPFQDKINNDIFDLFSEAIDVESKADTSPASIKAKITGEGQIDFLAYSETYLQRIFADKNRYPYYKKIKSVTTKLRAFIGEGGLPFKSLDVGFLRSYEMYLREFHGNSTNTVASNLQGIRAILYSAHKERIASRDYNPFWDYEIKHKEVMKESLTELEINSILEYRSSNGKLLDTKNIFLTCYYTCGMRISDALTMKWKNIQDGRLEYKMHKNHKVIGINICQELHEILSQYAGGDRDYNCYIFPFLRNGVSEDDLITLYNNISSSTALLNKNLKVIAKEIGIKKNLSTHIARHSFAAHARKNTGDLALIQKSMAHSSTKETERYLGSLPNDELDDFTAKVYARNRKMRSKAI